MKTKDAGARVIFLKRRSAEAELCHVYDGSAALLTICCFYMLNWY